MEDSRITANFNNLCSRNRVTSADGNEYAIRTKSGKYVVEDDVAENYDKFDDAYAFAAYMLDDALGQAIGGLPDEKNPNNDFEIKFRETEKEYYENNIKNSTEGKFKSIINLHKKLEELTGLGEDIYDRNAVSEENLEEYDATLEEYKKVLYNKVGAEIYAAAVNDESDITANEVDMDLFNYYVNLFNKIKDAGCVSIDDYNGALGIGDAANNSDWLQAMIQSGQFYIEATKNGKTDATTPASDISLSYTTTTTIDKTAYAKAEAKYEHDLKKIDQKDKQFDLDLSKLETERNALTTEYDSVKKVIQDNIDRTFGIFS